MKYKTSIVLAFFESEGLPKPLVEFRFHPERKWRFDFAFLDDDDELGVLFPKVAIEVQGGLFIQGRHNRGAALRLEHEKLNTAAELGWRILYLEPQNLCLVDTVKLIKRCLGI